MTASIPTPPPTAPWRSVLAWTALLAGAWTVVVAVPTPIAPGDPFGLVFALVRLTAAVLAARTSVATVAVVVARTTRSPGAARCALASAPRALRPAVRRPLAAALLAGTAALTVPGVASAGGLAVAGRAAGPTTDSSAPVVAATPPPAMWRIDSNDAPPQPPSPEPPPPEPAPQEQSQPQPSPAPVPEPASAPAAPSVPAPPSDPAAIAPSEKWTVARGEHLWSIAAQVLEVRLGRAPTVAEVAHHHGALIEVNRSRLADPDNPDLIFPGQELIVPAAP